MSVGYNTENVSKSKTFQSLLVVVSKSDNSFALYLFIRLKKLSGIIFLKFLLPSVDALSKSHLI